MGGQEEGQGRLESAHKKCVAYFKWVFEALVSYSKVGNSHIFLDISMEQPTMDTSPSLISLVGRRGLEPQT